MRSVTGQPRDGVGAILDDTPECNMGQFAYYASFPQGLGDPKGVRGTPQVLDYGKHTMQRS